MLTHGSGQVKERSDFYPFGEEVPSPSGNGNRAGVMDSRVAKYAAFAAVTQKFTGKERDVESGLDYFGARFTASSGGRFTGSDPLLESGNPRNLQSWNRYSCTTKNPFRFVDPKGLCSAPAVNQGEKGPCVDLNIAAPRINGIGHGDNRGAAPNDSCKTNRQEIQLAINVDEGTVMVVKDDPGVSCVTILRIPESPAELTFGRKDHASTTVSPVTNDHQGNGHFAMYNKSTNGLAALPAAPKDSIMTDLKFTFTPDGSFGLDPGGTRTAHPSLEVYEYDAKGTRTMILQVSERQPEDFCCRNQAIPRVAP